MVDRRQLRREFRPLREVEPGKDKVAVLIEIQGGEDKVWHEAGVVDENELASPAISKLASGGTWRQSPTFPRHLPGLSRIRVDHVGSRALDVAEVGLHARPHLFDVVEEVAAMLVVNAGDTIQEIALQTEGKGGAGGLLDGIACPRDVDTLDSLAGQLATAGRVAEAGDEPTWVGRSGQRWVSLNSEMACGVAYHTVATPCWGLARTRMVCQSRVVSD